ncbi:MAG: hypothetical protein Kow0090_12620 [Myxococcota bacterium]
MKKYVWIFSPNEHRLEKFRTLLANYRISCDGSTEIETHAYEEMRIWAPYASIIDMTVKPSVGKRLVKWFRQRIYTRDMHILLIGADEEFKTEMSAKDRFIHFVTMEEIVPLLRRFTDK